MLTDKEYSALYKRVLAGKKYLTNKWHRSEERELVYVWFDLVDVLFEEQVKRGILRYIEPHSVVLEQAMSHLEHMREAMIQKGLIRQPRVRRTLKTKPIRKEEAFI